MLEGPLSPLYRLIGRHLEAAGTTVHRINLCPGDKVAWGFSAATSYRGRKRDWPAFVSAFLDEHPVDALLMHSERRPYHLEAAHEARTRGIAVYVSELGYLRPDWMTLECNGNSVDSLFPTDPAAIKAIAKDAPAVDPGVLFPRERLLETRDDLLNALPNVFLWFFYPHYRAHGLYHPFVAYARFLWREAQKGQRDRAAQKVRARLKSPFFVFAMQTDTDFQIRSNSQFEDMKEALGTVFRSFKAAADPEMRIIVKKHPGDLGPVHWAAAVPALAAEAGLEGRVHFVDGLAMEVWCRDAEGLVTVNSSAGLDGLKLGRPTLTLSPAVYDVPGLTHQGGLDGFWTAPQAPDPALYDAFQRALAASIQVRGTIYNRAGTKAAASAIATRILEGRVGVPGAEVGPPPRYKRARALGIRNT
ncbi:MAG: capsular biosynthesis protein [Pseudomonadota bacterium]